MPVKMTSETSDTARAGAEAELWESFWKAGDADPAGRVSLVEFYIPLVVKIANSMPLAVRQKVPVEELLGAGVIGLHGAISSFSRDKNILFSTFAWKRIKGAMLDELRGRDRLTRTQRNCYREICAAINKLTAELGRPPADEEIAVETKMTVFEVDRYIGMASENINLSDEFEEGMSYMDVIADSQSLSPEDLAHNSLAMEKLREHFRELDEREQKILFLRHYQELSVKEIAKVMDISEGRISQIYQKIILKLRALMTAG
jgi:RNA polymerase sigma factor for flagellar operon FliA